MSRDWGGWHDEHTTGRDARERRGPPSTRSRGGELREFNMREQDSAWRAVAYLLSGPLIYGGLGYLADQWLGTTWLVGVGIVGGYGAVALPDLVPIRYAVSSAAPHEPDSRLSPEQAVSVIRPHASSTPHPPRPAPSKESSVSFVAAAHRRSTRPRRRGVLAAAHRDDGAWAITRPMFLMLLSVGLIAWWLLATTTQEGRRALPLPDGHRGRLRHRPQRHRQGPHRQPRSSCGSCRCSSRCSC